MGNTFEGHDIDIRQPGKTVDLENWPIEALSPVDCFHPSEKAHQRVAAGFWNRLTMSLVSGYSTYHPGPALIT